MTKKEINIVWFKRDLRLKDHLPLAQAVQSKLPCLLLYLFEPSVINDEHYENRHWRFVWESLDEMQQELEFNGLKIFAAHEESESFFLKAVEFFTINTVFSHEETGIDLTYQRDIRMAKVFEELNIEWKESPTNAVQRGLTHRNGWQKKWKEIMNQPISNPDLENMIPFEADEDFINSIQTEIPKQFKIADSKFQKGGESKAWELLKSFVHDRCSEYNKSISSPGPARKGCSRLSPHITWGNLSVRQIVLYMNQNYDQAPSKKGLSSFGSRLSWHCHFIQKFESEPRIEYENMNRGYDDIRTDWDEEKFQAWKEGKTGFPMVDACMRSVCATGYLNFRMRAMLVSFLTHHLWLHWQKGSFHLSKQFLDFEPGIHYPQFQMQAGTMGVNTVRIYNPVKQGYDQDSKGEFIKEWVPELRNVPTELVHEPWNMSEMEQAMYNCKIGEDYPKPIINDIKQSYKNASSILWAKKGSTEVKKENQWILDKHVKRRK